MSAALRCDLYDVHLRFPRQIRRPIGLSTLSFLRRSLRLCVDNVCRSKEDPMWNLTHGPNGILQKGLDKEEINIDESYFNYLCSHRHYVLGECCVDPFALLANIDLQFMTCVRSTIRIGEVDEHQITSKNNKNTSGTTCRPKKVFVWYENEEAFLPLPPFLASYSSSKTRTIYDALPSVRNDLSHAGFYSGSGGSSSKIEQTSDNNGEKMQRKGERAVREIIRCMDVLSTKQDEAMRGLTKSIQNELMKPPENRSWAAAERYRAAYRFVTTMRTPTKSGDGGNGNGDGGGGGGNEPPAENSTAIRATTRVSKRSEGMSSSISMDLNQLMTKYLMQLQQRCIVQCDQQIYLDVRQYFFLLQSYFTRIVIYVLNTLLKYGSVIFSLKRLD